VKVKLDENIPSSAQEILARAHHDVDSVLDEGLRGASDRDVLRAAATAGRLLITLDRGFGDIRQYPPGAHAGIVVLRPAGQSAATVRSALRELISHDLEALAGCVVVAQRDLLRIRRP
jgi:predicted nuclease of predicted toxin-antitoxin system